MTDDDWQRQRDRTIMAAFQTGRPVSADSDGGLRYADGDREALADDVGIHRVPLPAAAVHIGGGRLSPFWRGFIDGASLGPLVSRIYRNGVCRRGGVRRKAPATLADIAVELGWTKDPGWLVAPGWDGEQEEWT